MKISVVIPARNEEDNISYAVKSIIQQDFPQQNYEIIVVDNASSDRTAIKAIAAGASVIYEPRVGTNFARLTGVEKAQGDIIAFLDADNIAPAHWLKNIVQTFETHPKIVAMGGSYDLSFSSNILRFCATITQHTIERILPIIFCLFTKKPIAILYGGNMAAKKEMLLKSIDTRYTVDNGDDIATSIALAAQGKTLFNPKLSVQSSARRYQKKGIFKVCLYYTWIRFHVYFFNRPAQLPKWLT